MTNSFGYLNKLGYAGHLFPIVIGETGSFYTSAQVCRSPHQCGVPP